MRQPVLSEMFSPPVAPLVYPDAPGWKGTPTSHAAAESVDADTLRGLALDYLQAQGDHTADEIAAGLRIDRLAIRPRCSELKAKALIRDSGVRRPNASGKSAIVWTVRA